MNAIAELAVEAVGVEQREEELEVLFLAVVRRRGHQQQVADLCAELLREAKASRSFRALIRSSGRRVCALRRRRRDPSRRAQSLSCSSSLRESWSRRTISLCVIVERVAAGRGLFQMRRVNAEFEPKFLEQFVAPLLDQTSGSNDENAVRIRPHDEFADVKASHDRLAGARVVGKNEPQWLARQHGFVDRGDLVRKRFNVGCVNCHHRIEQEGQVDALGLAGELEGCAVTIERERSLGRCNADGLFVSASEQALFHRPVRSPVDELNGAFAQRHGRDH